MHADVLESEDAERGLDPFRLKIELPQVGKDPAGFVPAFDAVSLVVASNRGPRSVIASACETEEPLRHVPPRSEEHTSELQSPYDLVCRLLLEKKKKKKKKNTI